MTVTKTMTETQTQTQTMTDTKTMTETMTSVRGVFFLERAGLIQTLHCTDRHLPDDNLQDDDRNPDDDGLGDKDRLRDFDDACPYYSCLGLYRSHRPYINARAHSHGYRDVYPIQYLLQDKYADGDRY